MQRAHTPVLVHLLLGGPRGDIAGNQIAERWVSPLEVVVAFAFWDLIRWSSVLRFLRHPDTAIIAQGLRHQSELALEFITRRDAGWMDLCEGGVGELGALSVRPPDGSPVARHGICAEEICVAVTAGGEHHCMGRMG